MAKQAEFNGLRAKMYEVAIKENSQSRKQDLNAMYGLLAPQKGERILGIGEGNGFFVKSIADAVGAKGEYLVTDPSKDQLENLVKRVDVNQIKTQVAGAEAINVLPQSYDKVWGFGCYHHCPNQVGGMKQIYNALKPTGKVVICDVFQGSKLAEHFDSQVAKYCVTGHEVKFLSDAFAKSICTLAGFDESKVQITDLHQKWVYDSEYDLGRFIYNLHAMVNLPGSESEKIQQTLEGCKRILGVEKVNGKYELNWPMKALIATK